MRLRPKSAFFPVIGTRRSGYTLVEILVAMTLTLVLMTAVVTVFGGVGNGIANSRRAMEQFDRMRTAAQQLRIDLQGVTVTLDGRAGRPEQGRGYLEYIEGGLVSVPQANGNPGVPQAINAVTNVNDLTVGQRGDILMFTTRNVIKPFLGRYQLNTDTTNPTYPMLQSDVAEVAWFLRGKTLHRRVLLVAPGVAQNPSFARLSKTSFFALNDISVRLVNGQLVPNSLGDLTKRENRFAHPASTFPFDARAWGLLGLPTLYECSSSTWMSNWVNGTTPPAPSSPPSFSKIDMWDSADISNRFGLPAGTSPDQYLAQGSNGQGTGVRLADDVILTNVIGFDVKAWDPGAPVCSVTNQNTKQTVIVKPGDPNYPINPQGTSIVSYGAYVDLGWNPNYNPPQGVPAPVFGTYGNSKSLMNTGNVRVYDSGCFSYENEGIYNFNNSGNPVPLKPSSYPRGLGQWPAGTSTNGLDDDSSGVVDDASEQITSPPYPFALRGIQIKIRCFEPDSHQVREITIEHDFLPK